MMKVSSNREKRWIPNWIMKYIYMFLETEGLLGQLGYSR